MKQWITALCCMLSLNTGTVFAQGRGETELDWSKARSALLEGSKAQELDSNVVESDLKQLLQTSKRYSTNQEQLAAALNNLAILVGRSAESKLFDGDWCGLIAETALHNIAYPNQIEQGHHPTCNVSSLEVFAAARFPEQYTRLIKEVVLTGHYTTHDGTVVTPPPEALIAGGRRRPYASVSFPGRRSIASQIVQMTLINGAYELDLVKEEKPFTKDDGTIGLKSISRSDVRYILGQINTEVVGKNGERLGVRQSVGKDMLVYLNRTPVKDEAGQPIHSPELTQPDVVAASRMMLGVELPVIRQAQERTTMNASTGKVLSSEWVYDFPTKDRLLKAKQERMLPMGVATMGGAHAQTIHDVVTDEQGVCWVLIDDQFDDSCDGWVTLGELNEAQTEKLQLKPRFGFNDKP